MSNPCLNSKPKVVLAFGPAFSPWLSATYEPLLEDFDIVALASNPLVHSVIAKKVKTRLDMFRHFPRWLETAAVQSIYRIWPSYETIINLPAYIAGANIVHTVEVVSGPSLQVTRLKKKHAFRHIVTVWENIARRQSWHPWVGRVRSAVLHSADHFIAVSERAKTALMLEGAEPSRISVIGPGMIIPEGIKFAHPPASEFHLLFVGKKQRSKGVEELLLALWLACKDPQLAKIRITLRFLGIEPSKGPFADLIRAYGLGGFIEEIPFVPHEEVLKHFCNSHALVLPSKITPLWQEQWGMVLMEAMSQGLPIITTHSGSISEVSGDAALYARPNDHHSLYLMIKELAQNPGLWRRLSQNGIAASRERFPATVVSRRIGYVYKQMLDGRNGTNPL